MAGHRTWPGSAGVNMLERTVVAHALCRGGELDAAITHDFRQHKKRQLAIS